MPHTLNCPQSLDTYAESPESEHDDDEVYGVGEEHEHVDVGHGTVLRVDQVVEELADGLVEIHASAKNQVKNSHSFQHYVKETVTYYVGTKEVRFFVY